LLHKIALSALVTKRAGNSIDPVCRLMHYWNNHAGFKEPALELLFCFATKGRINTSDRINYVHRDTRG
jgi:hypothetical protein